MPITVLSTFSIGHLTALYRLDEDSGRTGLELFPSALSDKIVTPRQNLSGRREIDALPFPAPPTRAVESPLRAARKQGVLVTIYYWS